MNMRLVSTCCALLAGITAHAGNIEQSIKATLEARFPGIKIESVGPSASWQGMYEIVSDGQVAYTTEDARLLFAGKVMDTTTKEDLTQRRVNELFRIDYAALPFADAIKIVKGDGSRKLALFEDPLCPYCA